MKKIILSFGLIIIFAAYAFYQRLGGSGSGYLANTQSLSAPITAGQTSAPITNTVSNKSLTPKTDAATPPIVNQSTAQLPISTPTPAVTPSAAPTPPAKFKDGLFTRSGGRRLLRKFAGGGSHKRREIDRCHIPAVPK